MPRLFRPIALAFIALMIALTQSFAQRVPLVRDAEIEALIKDYARPLMKAAGLRPGSVRFFIVNDDSFNAFVSRGGMYLHTGLLLQSQTPGEVIGVIAHELGHITGGHEIRLQNRAQTARRVAQITTLLGLGLGVAGAASGDGNVAAAGQGVALGGNNIAMRGLLAYQRDEEASADRAAATYLSKAGISGEGMLRTFKRLAEQAGLASSGREDPYLRSHPAPRDRINALNNTLRKSKAFGKPDPASLQLRHDMMRAKIAAYSGNSRYARAVLADRSLHPNARLYGRAIVAHLYGSAKDALPLIDKLAKSDPKNAYLQEMRGEILLRNGKGKEAAAALARAVELDRYRAGFIRVQLGHAQLEAGGAKNVKAAISNLRKGLASDPYAVGGYQLLARAYGELGDRPNALLSSAEFSIRTGRKKLARDYARRAQESLKRGSPGWLRAQDILTLK
ncbi:M48 family metalloprotease [Pseudahrensia aquimaris]|uniref:M48 family metalloprotease n=1 Tax=Pseudahrensia aquimaris TaxID=744461 RepID=A0ABW3FIF5_9HYPH